MSTATGRKAPAPADYHGADGAPTCGYSIAGFAPCRRDPRHMGPHYDANGFAFTPDLPTVPATALEPGTTVIYKGQMTDLWGAWEVVSGYADERGRRCLSLVRGSQTLRANATSCYVLVPIVEG